MVGLWPAPRFLSPLISRVEDVARLKVEIITWPVKVRRHGGDEVAAVLVAVGLAQLDARDLGYRIRFVGRLKRASKERLFRDWLRGVFRVNAR